MQRFVPVLVALGPSILGAQQAAGAELWRLAGVTIPVPPALAHDGAAAFWNPAQEGDGARTLASIEAIRTPEVVGASGLLAALRVQVKGIGRVGVVYGRMQVGDLIRTSFAPDANMGTIPFYTHTAGLTWTRSFGATTLGATAGYHDTQLDDLHDSHWTFDVGASQRINDVLRIAAATPFFSRFQTADNVQDLYGGAGGPTRGGRGAPPGRGRRRCGRWGDGTDLPAALRADLDASFPLPRLETAAHQVSKDGTEKFLWKLADGEAVESVLIPEGRRRTLCISSQVGCALGCVFCATGRMGWRRDLTAGEITAQVRAIVVKDQEQKPTNVVFMGRGEPLLNWEAVDAALTILNHPDGLGIGARHITVSTVGILANLAKLARRPEQFRLALSLHAPTSALRLALMPIEKKYALPDVVQALRQIRPRVTLEYVLIDGRNEPLAAGG